MFQYATTEKIYEDTGLITKEEAYKLWDKYYSEVVRKLQGGEEPQMAIWIKCKNETDYSEKEKEIDYYGESEVKDGIVYKKELTKIINPIC